MSEKQRKKRYVVVTDKLRGVYFGLSDVADDETFVVLEEARLCFSWTARAGLGSLAVDGPGPGSKIGPEMPRMSIVDRANVIDCTPEAVERWKKSGWGDE